MASCADNDSASDLVLYPRPGSSEGRAGQFLAYDCDNDSLLSAKSTPPPRHSCAPSSLLETKERINERSEGREGEGVKGATEVGAGRLRKGTAWQSTAADGLD